MLGDLGDGQILLGNRAYDRDPENYLASVKLAAIRIRLRTNASAA